MTKIDLSRTSAERGISPGAYAGSRSPPSGAVGATVSGAAPLRVNALTVTTGAKLDLANNSTCPLSG